jgi:hypothetical protein
MAKLSEKARVIRSKNAGPLELTLDVLFDRADDYHTAVASSSMTAAAIARRYGVADERVRVLHVAAALAIKINMPRPIVAGSPGDRDVYGAQQHRPLLDIDL